MILQPVRLHGNRVQRRKVLEEWIARRRHEHRVSRVAEQLEQQRVALAAAGGDGDAFGRDANPATAVVCCDRLARHAEAERLRVVRAARAGPRALRADPPGIEPARRRIRLGEVADRTFRARRSDTRRVSAFGSRSGGTRRENLTGGTIGNENVGWPLLDDEAQAATSAVAAGYRCRSSAIDLSIASRSVRVASAYSSIWAVKSRGYEIATSTDRAGRVVDGLQPGMTKAV